MKTKFKLLLGNRFPVLPWWSICWIQCWYLNCIIQATHSINLFFVCPNKQRRQFSITTRANNNFTKVKYHLLQKALLLLLSYSQHFTIYSGNAFYISHFHTACIEADIRSPSTQHWNIFHDQMISHKIEFLPFMLWINYYVCMNDGIAKDLQACINERSLKCENKMPFFDVSGDK